MTEEQIKQTSKITEFARNMVKQSNYPEGLQDHIIATCMVVVTEATNELQKENAELKSDNTEWERASDKWESVYELTNNQLTKAKEIIKTCLGFMQAFGYSPSIDKFVTEAEQFLNEVEK